MKRILLALLLLSIPTWAGVTNQTVNQGQPGLTPWLVTGSFSSSPDVNVHDGSANPISSTTTWLNVFLKNTAITSNIGTTGGLALDSSLSTINTTLGTPFQSGGSIGNASFGISGLLPAYAATPTFNIGTTGGIALDATLSTLSSKFGTLGQKTMAGSAPVVIASDQSAIAVTQASQPLPSGAATSANQSTQITAEQATQASAASIDSKLTTTLNGVKVDVQASVLPTGAATSANQATANSTLSTINTTLGSPMQNSGGSVTANAGTNLNTSALNLEATQSSFKSANHTDLTTINSTLGSPFQAGGAISNTSFAATQATAASLNATVVTTGGATIAKDASVTGLQVTQGSTTSGQSGALMQAAVSTNQPSYTTAQTSPLSLSTRGGLRAKAIGLDTVTLVRNDYSSVNVTTAAYTQLVASTSLEINRLLIFDSSGQDLVLAVGAAASEVDQIQIPPGGWDSAVELFIPSGSRISVKSKSATASSGLLLITGLK